MYRGRGALAGRKKITNFAVMKHLFKSTFAILALTAAACTGRGDKAQQQAQAEPEPPKTEYGIVVDDYRTEQGVVAGGQTVGSILSSYGISAAKIDRLDKAAAEVFPLRQIRAVNRYTMFLHQEGDSVRRLDYMVYHRNPVDYVVFAFDGDSVGVATGARDVTTVRRKHTATISSSLWGAIMEHDMPYALAAELDDIYQWTIDFFGIQKGDGFTVIYDEKYIDTVCVGIGQIWGARFDHAGKTYYAIPFKQDGKLKYWEADGKSLRKQMLKAPLKYTRISSKFSKSRLHPVHKVYRPHLGVDYAAPTGTPVHSVADGVVTFKGWGGGGDNTLKIKHAGNLMTGYLHLSRYAPGISVGTRVSQGQLIGYVGRTGTATGPHLDYRIWKNGTPIDPLKIPQEPAEPVAVRMGARPHRGRARRRSDRCRAHHAARFDTGRDRTYRARQHGDGRTGTRNRDSAAMIDKRISKFIGRHHVMTLATLSEDGSPYCANCFYAYDAERNLLIFTSDISTRHASCFDSYTRVAASIVLETRIVGRVEGLQLCGSVSRADAAARRRYIARFPYAAAAPLTLWAIEIDYMKFTDNTLGFGKKLIWQKESQQ